MVSKQLAQLVRCARTSQVLDLLQEMLERWEKQRQKLVHKRLALLVMLRLRVDTLFRPEQPQHSYLDRLMLQRRSLARLPKRNLTKLALKWHICLLAVQLAALCLSHLDLLLHLEHSIHNVMQAKKLSICLELTVVRRKFDQQPANSHWRLS